MAQIKIYGLKTNLTKVRTILSNTIHNTIVDILSFPKDKKYHRFIGLNKEDMIFPSDKSEQYIIIEIMMIEGRKKETKKNLINALFTNINKELNISVNDIEISIWESPASNWGFRGQTADEIQLNYNVKV